MDGFFQSNPGIRSRIAHHVDFPDYGDAELLSVLDTVRAGQDYRLDEEARAVMANYIALRRQQPRFANVRSFTAEDEVRVSGVFAMHAPDSVSEDV